MRARILTLARPACRHRARKHFCVQRLTEARGYRTSSSLSNAGLADARALGAMIEASRQLKHTVPVSGGIIPQLVGSANHLLTRPDVAEYTLQ